MVSVIRDSNPFRDKNVSLLKIVLTVSRIHPASYSIGSVGKSART